MIDRTQEDINQDRRIDALERSQRSTEQRPSNVNARLDRLEAEVAELKAKLAPFDNVVRFIQELRFRGHLPNLVGF